MRKPRGGRAAGGRGAARRRRRAAAESVVRLLLPDLGHKMLKPLIVVLHPAQKLGRVLVLVVQFKRSAIAAVLAPGKLIQAAAHGLRNGTVEVT